jgi:sugar phosphate isomerase/epimerase
MTPRRAFLTLPACLLPRLEAKAKLKLGVMDLVAGRGSAPESVAKAKEAGFEGLQVTLGRSPDNSRMLLEDESLIRAFVAESKKHALPLCATYIDILHIYCLKIDPKAAAFVAKGIEITRKLKAGILMTVFFGKCDLTTRAEADAVVAPFKELAREAERADVVLGFENLLSAEENLRVVERVGSRAFKVYYDVANTTNMKGFDAPGEIRRLGRNSICQFHFKDRGYLGEGKVDFRAVLKAIDDIGFEGYATFETNSPSKDAAADLRRNRDYIRSLMASR